MALPVLVTSSRKCLRLYADFARLLPLENLVEQWYFRARGKNSLLFIAVGQLFPSFPLFLLSVGSLEEGRLIRAAYINLAAHYHGALDVNELCLRQTSRAAAGHRVQQLTFAFISSTSPALILFFIFLHRRLGSGSFL